MPKAYAELMKVRATLEKHFKDVQDIEFTDPGRQAVHAPDPQRQAHRRGRAQVLHGHGEGEAHRLEDRHPAATRPTSSTSSSRPIFDLAEVKKATEHRQAVSRPVRAPPPARSTSTPTAPWPPPRRARRSCSFAVETSPEDLRGMIAAEGILTARGRCQLARRARRPPDGQGLRLRRRAPSRSTTTRRPSTVAGQTFNEGDYLSIDGTGGTVYGGQIKTAPSEIITGLVDGDKAAQKTEKFKSFQQLMNWCAQGYRASPSAPTPTRRSRPRNAVAFGAVGIGLTRTEHMFFEGDRIDAMREMILADNAGRPRRPPWPSSCRIQREDFTGIFKALKGLPATIRLLDPAAARIPAARRGAAARPRQEARRAGEKIIQRVHDAARVQPDAGSPRLPPRHRLPGNHRHAGPRHLRSRG